MAPETLNFLPEFCDIVIERVTCRDCGVAVRAKGNTGMIHDIIIRNSCFFYEESGCDIDDPKMIFFDGCSITGY